MMKNRYFRWAIFGIVLAAINAYKKYHDDTAKHITHSNTEWLLIIMAYIGIFMLLMFVITAIMQKLRKDRDAPKQL